MESIPERLKAHMEFNPLDTGDPNCGTVLDQIYRAYAESHESDPPEIQNGFRELETFVESLPLPDNNAVFNLVSLGCLRLHNCKFFKAADHIQRKCLALSKKHN